VLNRREALQAGALGAVFGFLFRGRTGALQEEPIALDQKPAAATITFMPQRAFRPERLVISGIVVGKRMVPVREFVACAACAKRGAELGEDDDTYCDACEDMGGTMVETGEQREEDVRVIPWTIEDISIGGVAQFAPGTEVPGDIFSSDMTDARVQMDTAGPGAEIRFRVRYTGDKPGGERFRAALVGRAVGEDGLPRMAVLPIDSGVEIVA